MNKNTIEITHAVLILTGAMLMLLYYNPIFIIIAGVISFSGMIYADWPKGNFRGLPGGLANWITAVRLVVLIVAVILSEDISHLAFASIVIGILILDGLDGYIARKRQEQTEFGAFFDMEVDAFLAACLSLVLVFEFQFSPLVLFAGLMRYYFLLLKKILGWQNRPTPKMRGVRLFAVLYFISLISPFVLPIEIARWVVYAGIAIIVFSFGRELVILSSYRNSTGD